MIKIKEGSTAKPEMFLKLSTKLLAIFFDLVNYLDSQGVKEVIITSMFREGDVGVHGSCRGIDISVGNIPVAIRQKALLWVNMKYKYDVKRPDMCTMIMHSTDSGAGDGGLHFHLQCMP